MPKIIPNYTTIPGQGFTILDLDLGEIALNVSDGNLYLKKETAGVQSVVILAGPGNVAVSSSYALTSSYANYAAVALNATNSLNTLFGIFSLHSYYSQLARTASFAYKADYSEFALNSLTATNASTASLPIRGIITASAAGSTITFTKGDSSTFNVTVTTATAQTASYITSSNVDGPYGKNSILTASYALTASLPLQGLITASAAGSTITFTKGDSSTFNVTVTTATAETASYVSSSNVDGPYGKNSILSASYAVTASYVLNAISASYAFSASQAVSSSYALSASQAVSSSYALSASFASTASYSLSSLSASYTSTASNVEGGTTNYITLWRTNTALTSSVMYQSGSNITIGGGAILPSARLEVKGAGSTSATVALNVVNTSSTDLLYLRNDGFVGIGTASAASTENMFVKKQWTVFNQGNDLTNYTIVDVSNTTSVLRLGVETNSGGGILTGTTAYAGIVGTTKNFPLQFITNNTVKATLLNTGNFGIGITSPLYTLDVSGSARITSSVFLPGLTNVSQPHLVSYNSSSGQLYYLATSSFTASWANNAVSSSYPIAVTGSTIYSRLNTTAFSTVNSIFLGNNAGNAATNANGSNFIGSNTGNAAINANSSNFIGSSAGGLATNASQSNFIGSSAGTFSTNANNSNFIGNLAGAEAENAFQSNFIGQNAGLGATNANNSNFIGNSAGSAASNASYSILIGTNVGKKVSGTGIGSNNIIIGTNITFTDGRQDSINLGGIIFGTGSYSTTTGNPFSGSANGRIGINVPLPIYSLDVSGSGNFTNNLTSTGSIYFPSLTNTSQPHFVVYNSSSGQLYYLGTGSFTAATASYVTSSNVYGPYGSNSILSASYALSASQAQNAVSASYVLNAISASYAATASSADNFLVRGTLTAQTIIAQVITSSTDFVTGSTRFGTQLTNTHQFTGSVSITGSLTVVGVGITGSLFGTASWAVSASQALTASYVLNAVSSSYALSASQAQNATTASYVLNAVSASFASTASFVQNAISASFASTASFVQNAVSASFASTASYVLNAVSASFASTASFVQNAISASFASTASLAQNALTASFVTASNVWGPFGSNSIISSSFASTASFVQNAVSASFAATASSADNFTVRGTLTSQTIVTQVITSSTDFVTGSSRFGTLLSNTHQFTGSVSITGSLTVVGAGITGSLFGTASWANNTISSSYALSASQAQNAVSASYVLNAVSASYALSASNAQTASYVLNAVSASFATTASYALSASQAQNAVTASYVLNAVSSSFASTASFVQNAVSASFAATASFVQNAVSASFAATASFVQNAVSSSFASTASLARNALTASFITASNVFGPFGSNSIISASYALSASQAQNTVTASYVLNAVSASFASTASFVQNAVSASFAATASSADNFTVRNTLTATTIVVQTITSSIDFVTGSSRFGTLLSNTHQFTGSVSMTGSLTVVGAGITGSLFGTSSWAVSASQALTASYVLNAVSSSFASTASFVQNAVSASFANTASYVLNAVSSSFASTASFVQNAVSASFASTASFVQNAVSASFALSSSRAVSASFALTSSYITASGVFGPFGSNSVISASHAVSASRAITASYASNANLSGGTTDYIPIWTSNTTLGISQIYQTQSAFTNTAGNYDISHYIASSADGSAAIVFRGTDYVIGGNTQINHTSLGISSFVNYGFASYTGSGFYGSGSLDLDSVRLSFLDTDKFEFSSSGMFRAADDIVGFYSFSDRNLKYDIRQVCGSVALDQVQQLQGVYYKWIGNQGSRANREEIGLIAQDVEKVIPQLVREQERLGQGTFKTVDYNHLTALLIEAIKEQQKQIDELKSKLDALTK